MLLAAVMILVIGVCRGRWARRVARLGVVGVLAGLFLYSFVVQRDYVTDWAHQRNFLTQLMMLSPDVHADTLFIVKVPSLTESLLPGSDSTPVDWLPGTWPASQPQTDLRFRCAADLCCL